MGPLEAAGLLALLYGASDALFRWLGVGALAHGPRSEAKLALTFDDGPDPKTTPELLDALDEVGVKAAFFLTGKKAEAHPELVAEIKRRGHEIASHGYYHRPPLLMDPITEWRHTSYDPGGLPYYRPPHGSHSPLTRALSRIFKKQVVLWDLESKDWTALSEEELIDRLLEYAQPGSVALFHDGVARTPQLVRRVVPELVEMGFEIVSLSEVGLFPLDFKTALIRGLQGFDERYEKAHGIRRCRRSADNLFRCSKSSLPAEVPGVRKGARGLELHFDSRRVAAKSPLAIVKSLRRDLKAAAKRVAEDPEIEVVFAVTPLVEGAKEFLGFEVAELPRGRAAIDALARRFFDWLYRDPRYPPKNTYEVKLIYLPRKDFLTRYG